MNFHVLTIFPEQIKDVMNVSIIGRAIENKLINLNVVDIREYSKDKHKKTDDYPFGGGAGMLMTPQPIYDAFVSVKESIDRKNESKNAFKRPRVLLTTPSGRRFDQNYAKELSKEEDIVIICGHYEGIDQRINDLIVTDEVSIGDYVLTGGELPACIMMDSISRLIPGVLNKEESHEIESFEEDLLEYPQYTRPREFMGLSVPEVLVSGNHAEIEKWRLEMSKEKTRLIRTDLFKSSED